MMENINTERMIHAFLLLQWHFSCSHNISEMCVYEYVKDKVYETVCVKDKDVFMYVCV